MSEEEFVEETYPEDIDDLNRWIPEEDQPKFTAFLKTPPGPYVYQTYLAGENPKSPPTIDDMFYAEFARDVYNNKNSRNNIKDYKYQVEDSTEQVGVYTNNNNVVFGIKGTDGNNVMENMLSNIAIVQGGSTINPLVASAGLVASGLNPATALTAGSLSMLAFGAYQSNLTDLENQLGKVKEKYPNKQIKISGHSKGGSFANVLGISNKNADVYTFNAGVGLPNLYNKVKCYFGDCSNIKNFRITGDFASALPKSFSEGQKIELKPKIPDLQTQLESKTLESVFIPADLYIPHSIRNFNDRNPKNLMPDYGLFGRTLSRRVGSAIGAVAPLVAPKLLDKTANLIGKATLRIPGMTNTITEKVIKTSRRSATQRLIQENLSANLLTSPTRSQTLADQAFSNSASEILLNSFLPQGSDGEVNKVKNVVEKYQFIASTGAKKILDNKVKNRVTKGMKDLSKYISKNTGSINSGIVSTITSGGIGDILGASIYDPFIKSTEDELGGF
jgi:hypothetical protein